MAEISALKKKILNCYYEGDLGEGLLACESLRRTGEWTPEDESNSLFYLPTLANIADCHDFKMIGGSALKEKLLPHFRDTNPSIAIDEEGVKHISFRSVNYALSPYYDNLRGFFNLGGENKIRSFNTILRGSVYCDPIRPTSLFGGGEQAEGFEDMRLFFRDGRLHALATLPQLLGEWPVCELMFSHDCHTIEAFKPMVPVAKKIEKNWAPVEGRRLALYAYESSIYSTSFLVFDTEHCHMSHAGKAPHALRGAKGSSQLVAFRDGFISLVHYTSNLPDGYRVYYHRFVTHDSDISRVTGYSKPFRFSPPGRTDLKCVEFCAGLATVDDELIATFGWDDCESWQVSINSDSLVLDQ